MSDACAGGFFGGVYLADVFAADDCDVIEMFEVAFFPQAVGKSPVGIGFFTVLSVIGVVDEKNAVHMLFCVCRYC